MKRMKTPDQVWDETTPEQASRLREAMPYQDALRAKLPASVATCVAVRKSADGQWRILITTTDPVAFHSLEASACPFDPDLYVGKILLLTA